VLIAKMNVGYNHRSQDIASREEISEDTKTATDKNGFNLL